MSIGAIMAASISAQPPASEVAEFEASSICNEVAGPKGGQQDEARSSTWPTRMTIQEIKLMESTEFRSRAYSLALYIIANPRAQCFRTPDDKG
jgi:hypothetical protein